MAVGSTHGKYDTPARHVPVKHCHFAHSTGSQPDRRPYCSGGQTDPHPSHFQVNVSRVAEMLEKQALEWEAQAEAAAIVRAAADAHDAQRAAESEEAAWWATYLVAKRATEETTAQQAAAAEEVWAEGALLCHLWHALCDGGSDIVCALAG